MDGAGDVVEGGAAFLSSDFYHVRVFMVVNYGFYDVGDYAGGHDAIGAGNGESVVSAKIDN